MDRRDVGASFGRSLLRICPIGGALLLSLASCGGPSGATTNATGTKACETLESCKTLCFTKGISDGCVRALEFENNSSNRTQIVKRLCHGAAHDAARCCDLREEVPNELADTALLSCGHACFGKKQTQYCDMFAGPAGYRWHTFVCERLRSEEACAGLSEETRAEIEAQFAESQAASRQAFAARKERETRDAAQRAENDRRQQEEWGRQSQIQQRREIHCRVNWEDPTCPKKTPNVAPTATVAAPVARRSCQYMFLSGGVTSSGWQKVMRHFYDAPDCGGTCCAGVSRCCVDRKAGREFCSPSPPSSSEPVEVTCGGSGTPRDTPRDDYTPLPVVP